MRRDEPARAHWRVRGRRGSAISTSAQDWSKQGRDADGKAAAVRSLLGMGAFFFGEGSEREELTVRDVGEMTWQAKRRGGL